MKDIFIAVIKILFFILIVPFIGAFGLSFYHTLIAMPAVKWHWLLNGALIFTGVYFFIYHFREVSLSTSALLAKLFAFLGPMANVASLMFPIYAILVVAIYLIAALLEKTAGAEGVFLGLISFLLMMHWVTTAKDIFEADQSLLKAHYFFSYGLLLIWHLSLGALLLNAMTQDFNAWVFFKESFNSTKDYYLLVYRFLFVDSIA